MCCLLSGLLLVATPAVAARPLTLAEAVAIGLRADPQLAAARAQIDRSKNAVLRAQLDRVSLRVDGQLQELWNKQNIGGAPMYRCTALGITAPSTPEQCAQLGGQLSEADTSAGQGLLNLSANLNVPIFSGFRVSANVRRAQIQEQAATALVRQARKDIALAVARAYWSVRRVELMRDVERAAVERKREAEAVADGRMRAGLAPPIDGNRARFSRVQEEARLADLDGQAREALAQLAVALGLAPSESDLALVDAPRIPEDAPPAVATLLESARGARPELSAARLQIDAQRETLRMVRSVRYPQLSAFGLLQFGNNPFQLSTGARSATSNVNPFENVTGTLTVGATLSMNFFDTLTTFTAYRDARWEIARLEEERRRAGRIVEGDVRIAHARLERLYARRARLREAADVARDNGKILEARYRSGDALVFEFLQAQDELSSVELQLADLDAQLQATWLELDAALGNVIGDGK